MSGIVQGLIGSLKAAAAGGDPNWASVTLLLPGDGTNGAQNNTFTDASTNNFTITRNGNTTQGTFSPFTAAAPYSAATKGGSGYFDGTGDYLSWSGTTLSGDFTVECWVYKTAVDASGYTVVFSSSSVNNQLAIDATTAGSIALAINGSTIIAASGTAVTLNAWHHLAWVREGTTCRAYVNGVQQGTGTSSASLNLSLIGQFQSGGYEMNGYISSVRILSGTCQYPGGTTFTPPTSPLTAITNTQLLLNFTNAGIIDNAMLNVLETVGNAQISTAQSKFGGSSILFDGTGDWLLSPNNVNLQLGTGNFTVEFWVYLASGDTGSNRGLVAKGGASTGWLVSLNTTEKVVFTYTTSTITSSGAISTNAWNHIAVVREGTGSNQTKIYINGTNDGTGTVSTDFNQTEVLYVGANRVAGDPMKGYIDDLRITKGVARYTTTFTPPAAAFPTS
jgi:hypothetical protein